MKHAREGMRPSSRPKHVRRASTMRHGPRHDYTARRPYLETPARPFVMPPEGAGLAVRAWAATYCGLAAMYAVAWAYGCARWGWGL